MSDDTIPDSFLIERIKRFGAIIALSLFTIIVCYSAAYFYYKNEESRLEAEKQMATIQQENAKRLLAIQGHAMQIYVLRNDVEEIALRTKDKNAKEKLLAFKVRLNKELTQTNILLRNILESKAYNSKTLKKNEENSAFSIYLISNAYAQNRNPVYDKKPGFGMYFAATIITIALIFCVIILVMARKSKKTQEEVVKFAISTIQSVIGFAIGFFTGPALTLIN